MTVLAPTPWTRPQQRLAAGYGAWTAVWTLVVGFVLMTPDRVAAAMRDQGYGPAAIAAAGGTDHVAGILGVSVSALLGLAIGWFSLRGRAWAFWAAMIWFGFTGLGALWVPLRPQAHVGEEGLTLIVHAFVDDLPGLVVGIWLLVGLVRYRHAWARVPIDPTDRPGVTP